MTPVPSAPEDFSPASGQVVRSAPNELPTGSDSPGTDPLNLWGPIRRNILLIGTCTGLAAIAAVVVTSRTPPVYEATASLRIDDKGSPLAALAGGGAGGGTAVATEIELLRSRQLAEEIADSVEYQLVVHQPHATARSAIFASIAVARTAEPAQLRLIRAPGGRYALVGALGDTLARGVTHGERVEHKGLAFELAPTATLYPAVEFEVLTFDAAVDSLQKATLVGRRSRDAELVDVSVRDDDPTFARDVANTLVRRFIQGRQGARQVKARSTVTYLREQSEQVAAQLASAAQALGDFRRNQHIVSLPAEASSGVARRAELHAQRNTLEAERQALENVFRTADSRGDNTGDPGAYRELLSFPTLLKSGIASDLVTALAAAEERRAELLSRRTERDPEVGLVNARIAELQRQIRARVSTYLRGLTDQVAALDSLLSRSDARLESIPAKETRLAELERMVKGHEEIYAMLQSRLKEAEIAATATEQSVSLVDAAILPRTPVAPRPLLNLALGLMAGGMLGLAGTFLREHRDRSLHTRREVLAATGAPVLGLIPELGAVPRVVRDLAQGNADQDRHSSYGSFVGAGTLAAPVARGAARPSPGLPSRRRVAMVDTRRSSTSQFIFTEAHARLATNLAFLPRDRRPTMLMVTSSLPRDGKTTVAANLALAVARSGERVLLVDADLRGGCIAHLVGIPKRPGLIDVLAGRAEPEQVLAPVGMWNAGELHVIGAGALTDAPAELLGSGYAKKFIEWARAAYDMVIIDTPPVTSVADAAALAPLVDGVVLVVRAGVTARDALAFALEQLRIVRAPLLGAVLNGVDLRRDSGYDGAYEYYGRYPQSAV